MRRVVRPDATVRDGLSGQWVSLDELGALELFQSTKRPFKVKLAGNFAPRPGSAEPGIKAAVRREYAAGDVICEAGSYGSTAFLLVEGRATSFVPERAAPAEIPGRKRRSLRSLLSIFRRRTRAGVEPTAAEVGEVSGYATFTSARVPPPVTLEPGDVVGVDACVNFYPRATTVRALERCVAIEMLRSVLDTIREAGTAGAEITARYRERAIRQELFGSPLLEDVGEGDVERLAARATLLARAPAEGEDTPLYREGEAAETVYLVRSGTVKIMQKTAAGESIVAYLGRGSVLGLEPLLAADAAVGEGAVALMLRCVSHPTIPPVTLDKPVTIGRGEGCEVGLPADDRSVSRRHCLIEPRDGAVYAVDQQSANGTLVNGERIETAKLHVGDRVAVVEYAFEVVAASGDAAAAVRRASAYVLDDVEVVTVPAADLLGIAGATPSVARARETAAAPWTTSAKPLADDGILAEVVALNLYNSQNTLLIDLERCTRCDECVRACATAHDGVARFTRDGPRFGKYLVTMACRSCTDPKCMIGCPVGSIRRRDSLEIHIESWCIGCQKCATQCPFGNINMVELATAPQLGPPVSDDVKLRATVCDLCAGYQEPSCVYACPHDAAIRVNPAAFLSSEDRL